jgi:hypothetical protein
VSGRFRAVLEGFRLPAHRFYPAGVVHRKKAVSGYSWLHLPDRLPLPDGVTLAEAEAGILGHPELAGADLVRLYDPRAYNYCFVSAPLRAAVAAAGLTGVTFDPGKTVLFAPAGT